MKPVRLAILGLGTVGGGALKLLKENAAEIKRRTGREIQITYVGTRRPRPDLELDDSIKQSADLLEIVRQPDVDVVVEVVEQEPVLVISPIVPVTLHQFVPFE